MDLIWGAPVASTDRWVGALSRARLTGESHQLTHLAVKRGLLLRRLFVVPIDDLERGDHEALYLGLSTSDFFGLGKTVEGGGRAGGLDLDGRTRVMLEGGAKLKLAGVRIRAEDRSLTHLLVRRGRLARDTAVLPLEKMVALSSGETTTKLGMHELVALPRYRRDREIERDVWDALYRSDSISPVDLHGIRVSVTDGKAAIDGNVREPETAAEVARFVASVDGAVTVEDMVVNDWDIRLGVAAAISSLDSRLLDTIEVRSHLGTVTLKGHVPSADLTEAVLRAARDIGGVRDVQYLGDGRPEVAGRDDVPGGP